MRNSIYYFTGDETLDPTPAPTPLADNCCNMTLSDINENVTEILRVSNTLHIADDHVTTISIVAAIKESQKPSLVTICDDTDLMRESTHQLCDNDHNTKVETILCASESNVSDHMKSTRNESAMNTPVKTIVITTTPTASNVKGLERVSIDLLDEDIRCPTNDGTNAFAGSIGSQCVSNVGDPTKGNDVMFTTQVKTTTPMPSHVDGLERVSIVLISKDIRYTAHDVSVPFLYFKVHKLKGALRITNKTNFLAAVNAAIDHVNEYNSELLAKPLHPFLGNYILALSSKDQQYYMDRIITNIDLYNAYYERSFLYNNDLIPNDPHQNINGHKFYPFLLPEHLNNRCYCDKLRNQFNIYYQHRIEAQLQLEREEDSKLKDLQFRLAAAQSGSIAQDTEIEQLEESQAVLPQKKKRSH